MMIPSVRGTRDILPGEVERWAFVEATARRVFEQYGYFEIRTPIIEREELFSKGTGETTDIVQKEMYAFTDKGGERITLRPEATPSMVRAFVEHALEQAMAVPKLYAMGPMFRYERPQKGRYRQFHQLDVEVFGVADPSVDAEVIDLAWALVSALGITGVDLAINSVGCPVCRPAFSAALVAALGEDVGKLCGDCQRRAATNPLRIFDCKVPGDQAAIDALPHSVDYLCAECRAHFDAVRAALDLYGIPYAVSASARARSRLLHPDDVRDPRRPARRPERDPRRRALRRPGEAIGRPRPRGHWLCGRHRAPRPRAARAVGGCRPPARCVRGRAGRTRAARRRSSCFGTCGGRD